MNCTRFHIRALRAMLMLLIPLTGFMAHQHHAHLDPVNDPGAEWHTHHHHHGEQHTPQHEQPEHRGEASERPYEHDHQPVSSFLQLVATAGNRTSTDEQAIRITGEDPLTDARASFSDCVPRTRSAIHANIPTALLQQQSMLLRAANLSPPSLG